MTLDQRNPRAGLSARTAVTTGWRGACLGSEHVPDVEGRDAQRA